jgi:uncharacterized protein with FMN-binding domain
MKKLTLSISTVFLFVLYSLWQRNSANSSSFVSPISSGQNLTVPSPSYSSGVTPSPIKGNFKDGQYTGQVADAFYGNVQVKVTITNGAISDVQFLQYPNDRRTSIQINSQATPMLRSEAIQAQSANVNIVSGATDTSQAFIASLTSALNQAQ